MMEEILHFFTFLWIKFHSKYMTQYFFRKSLTKLEKLVGTSEAACPLTLYSEISASHFSWNSLNSEKKDSTHVSAFLETQKSDLKKTDFRPSKSKKSELSSKDMCSTAKLNSSSLPDSDQYRWNQWLAGRIDGDGCFVISRKGSRSLEITMGLEDEFALAQVKDRFGGSIKLRSGVKAIRYRLHHKDGLMELISCVNGFIRNTVRLPQFQKACDLVGISWIPPKPLSKTDGYFAGLFDADGTVTFSFKKSGEKMAPQRNISVTQKYKVNVDFFPSFFLGNVYCDRSQNGYFKWMIFSQSSILNFLEYVKISPVYSLKKQRLHRIPLYFELTQSKAYEKDIGSAEWKAWQSFMKKWG